ncbi:MAG: hypothetical protein Q9202_001531 [Teloschistes flavicans]
MPAILIFTTLSPSFFTLAGAFFSAHNPAAVSPDHYLLLAIAFLNAGLLVLLGLGLYCWICARRPPKSYPVAAGAGNVELGAWDDGRGRGNNGQPPLPPPAYSPRGHRPVLRPARVYTPPPRVTTPGLGGRVGGGERRRCGECYLCTSPYAPVGASCRREYERERLDGYFR